MIKKVKSDRCALHTCMACLGLEAIGRSVKLQPRRLGNNEVIGGQHERLRPHAFATTEMRQSSMQEHGCAENLAEELQKTSLRAAVVRTWQHLLPISPHFYEVARQPCISSI